MLSRKILAKLNSILKIGNNKRFFYDSRTKNDTIFAPLTTIYSSKGSPLGVIRVSGSRSGHVLHQLAKTNKQSSDQVERINIQPRVATLARIVDPFEHELIDIGLVLWFPKPRSYTGEDSFEFHLHGSQAIISKILSVLGSMPGLRPAEGGEFSKRAVLNNKMTLIQAESLPTLISSKTDYQRKLALKGLDGTTRAKYELWLSSLVDILAYLEASIDFGEDELLGEKQVVGNCIKKLNDLERTISHFIDTSSRCRDLIQLGARVAILGKPNAGKSTFMNILCKKERSIVSSLSGTTRDVVEHDFELGGHAITLCDTAGLKDIELQFNNPSDRSVMDLLEQHDSIEREGIKRALKEATEADIIVYLIDGNNLTIGKLEEDCCLEIESFMKMVEEKGKIKFIHIVINKMDLNEKLSTYDCDKLEQMLNEIKSLNGISISVSLISCLSRENVDQSLNELIKSLNRLTIESTTSVNNKNEYGSYEFDYINERHLSLLQSTRKHLEQASKLNLNTVDEMAQHVRESLDYLSRIVGTVSNEQVVDVIFRDFCIGK